MGGWAKVKDAASYAGVSERTLRGWLQGGLEHARLPTGHILISYAAIDTFLRRFCRSKNQAEQIVDEIMREVRG